MKPSGVPLEFGQSYDLFAEKFLKIKHKTTSEMVPLVPTPAQAKIRAIAAPRKLILKGRQCGSSTDTMGRFFYGTILNENQSAMTIAHESGVSEDLLMKVRLFYENMPEPFRPPLEYASKWEMYWPAINSWYRIGTAGGKSVAVGRTVDRLHVSEFSKWLNARDTFLQALASVPESGEVVIESTAQGSGNEFHDMWKRATRDWNRGVRNSRVFVPIFISWMDDPSCAMKVFPGEDLDEFYPLTREMQKYEDDLRLTPEQRKWHRITRSQFGELFQQEYPSTPDEAFVANERCYFNGSAINGYRKNVEKPYRTGRLQTVDGKPCVVEDSEGALSVWRVPQGDHVYAIFADVAEGLEHGDFSCAYVYDVWEKDYVACWHGHIDPDLFADELDMLGRYYRGLDNRVALLGVENNSMGFSTVIGLRRRLAYPRLYLQKQFNKRDKLETERLGWRTDLVSKRFMLNLLNAEVRDGTVGIFDDELLNELATFLKDERGNGAAEPPNHDDRVLAAAGCLAISVDMPRKPTEPEPVPQFVPGDGMKYVNKMWELWDERRKVTEKKVGWNWEAL